MARIGINTGAAPDDGTGDSLRAGGGIINENFREIYTYFGFGSTTVLGSPLWEPRSVGINTLSNVGIGTTNPTSKITVSGDGLFTGVITAVDGIRGIGIQSGGVVITTGIITSLNFIGFGNTFSYSTATKTVDINISGSPWTFNTPAQPLTSNIYRVDGFVGIGTTNPNSTLKVIGGIGATFLNVSGISTLGVTTTTNLTSQQLNISGISTLGVTTTTNLTSQQLNISGISTFIGITTNTSTLFANQLSVSGVATLTTLRVGAGITLNSGNLGVSGISTFTGGLRASEGGDLARLRVSGIATFNHIYADGLTVVGVSTLNLLNINTTGIGEGDLGSNGGADGIFGIFNTTNSGTITFNVKNSGGTSNAILSLTSSSSPNVTVTGSFTATTKSFRISHPTKENYDLVYGSLEGPEHAVYVRGKASNVIKLPDYWTALVDENTITIQLTPIGNHMSWVEKIEDNQILIGGGEAFYFVQAERKDIEPLEVEVELPVELPIEEES